MGTVFKRYPENRGLFAWNPVYLRRRVREAQALLDGIARDFAHNLDRCRLLEEDRDRYFSLTRASQERLQIAFAEMNAFSERGGDPVETLGTVYATLAPLLGELDKNINGGA